MRRYVYLILFTLVMTLSFGESELYFDDLQFNQYSEIESTDNESLRVVQAVKVATLDPIYMKDQYSIRMVNYLYDTLFIYNANGDVVSNLVEAWDWKDDRLLELEIKDNIYFHNGDKMLAVDVKKSLDRMLSNGVFKDFFNDIQNVKVLSETKLEIKLKGRNNLFLSMLTYYMCSITKEVDGKIYGTGPYKIDKITNKEIVLLKNQNYFKKNNGRNKIEILSEVSDRKRALLYFNDAADVVLDITPKQIDEWKEEGIIDKSVISDGNKELDTIAIIFGKRNKIFERRDVRESINELIDRDELIENIFEEKATNTFFPGTLFDAKLSLMKNGRDSEKKVKDIFEGKEIEITVLNDDLSLKIANNLKRQLEKKGMKIVVSPYQQEAYLMKMEKQDYEIAIYNIIFDERYLIYNLGRVIAHDIGDKGMYNATLPFLEILKDEREKVDRDKIYDKIVYLISKNIPYIPLVHREKVAIERARVSI
ncbi:MAG: ABC transporter substrate-binding protein [Cetobacterium sp.]|uniref:ABC transporter substrate-binding protein n=1 Tax=Cetobacterium sp. TaxID=2071632 RepID=UPI003F2DA18D